MYKFGKNTRSSVDDFISSLNDLPALNVLVLKPPSECMNFSMKQKDEKVLNIPFLLVAFYV